MSLKINDDLRLIFIHIPKTGGIFIKDNILQKYNFRLYDKLLNTNFPSKIHKEKMIVDNFIEKDYSWLLNEKLMDYKYFCVRRCPYERFVSGFLYSSNKHGINSLKDCILNKERYKNGKISNIFSDSGSYTHIFLTQYHFIKNIPNLTILNFDNLNNDLCKFLLDNGIKEIKHENKPRNVTKKTNSKFWEYYDSFSLNFVNEYFDEDFKFFGFTKYNNLSDFYYHMIIKHNPYKDY